LLKEREREKTAKLHAEVDKIPPRDGPRQMAIINVSRK
jgi:hypothetical protein